MIFKLRPFFKEMSLTFIAEAIVSLALVFIYRLITVNFGPDGIEEYSLVKRITAILKSFLLLGFGVELPRYVAMFSQKHRIISYIKTGLFLVTGITLIFSFFINLFKDYFAKIFFGGSDYNYLVPPLSFFYS